MKTWVRFVAALLVTVLMTGAVPPVARAQQPAEPPAQQQPVQPPAQLPTQPGMMQEQMKQSDDSTWNTVANIYNIAYVPGKAILCGLGGITAFVLMAVTFGSAYNGATATVREGCGGPWTLTADDVRPADNDNFYQPKEVMQK